MGKTKYFTLIYYAEFMQYGGWALMVYAVVNKFGNLKMWVPTSAFIDRDGWWGLAWLVFVGLHMVVIGQLFSNFIDIEVNTRSRKERYQRDDPY